MSEITIFRTQDKRLKMKDSVILTTVR